MRRLLLPLVALLALAASACGSTSNPRAATAKGHGITASSADDAKTATDQLTQTFDSLGKDTFKNFPVAYRDRLVHQQALITAASRAVDTTGSQDPRAYFDAHTAEFEQACVSHLLVGTDKRS